MENQTEQQNNNPIINIENKINSLVGLKGIDREIEIKNVAIALYNFLKENNYKVIERDFLKTFFADVENTRTENRIFKDIISYLISINKIALTYKNKTTIYFKRQNLFCYMDSYAEILKKGCCISNNNLSIVKCNRKFKVKAFLVL